MAGRAISPSFRTTSSLSVRQEEDCEQASGGISRTTVFVLLAALAYYAGTWVGIALKPPGHAISVFWPPNAILLAALLLAPIRIWWILLLAVLPAHLLIQLGHGTPFPTAMGWFVSNTAEALIGAVCISRFARKKSLFDTFHGLLVFLIFGVAVAPLLTSFIDAAAVVSSGWGMGYWRLATSRLFSNMLAELTFVPMIVIFAEGGYSWLRQAGWRLQAEAVVLAAGIILVGIMVFGSQHVAPGNIPALVYVPLPLLLWASLRFGLGGLSASLLGIALISTWSALHGRGPFVLPSMLENIQSLQVMLCVVAVPLMLLAAVVTDRWRAEESLRDISGRLINTQERERQRIAREIHDDIGQQLALVELGLEHAMDVSHSSLQSSLSQLHHQVRDISRAAHELSRGLHPSHLDHLGFATAVRRLCRDMGRDKFLDIRFSSEGLPDRLPANISLCLYRVTQEALQNVVRHSSARTGIVNVKIVDGSYRLSIADDGVGFAVGRQPANGLGLTSMRERLRSVGGTLEIASEPTKGTRIAASVPMRQGLESVISQLDS
jgi:signal transduction histidine kinase